MNPNDALALQPTVQAWAEIVIKEWIRKAEALGIEGLALINSFTNHVFWAAAGDLQRVEFAFAYYGKFVDMGVGNGVNLANRDAKIATGLTRRHPKPWFTDTFYKQVAVLRHLISERIAQSTQLAIVRNITNHDSNPDVISI